MTHEQKPESAEFWTRGAQAEAIETYIHRRSIPAGWNGHIIKEFLAEELKEAEARGAAEQRRKDAANVTALEERVKELEGELSYLKDEALRFADMYPQSSDMRNTFGVFAGKIAARAAAIREGGEHG